MKPLVSILIPAYNAGNWIAETLRSAVAQTWPEKEIIVVDDGSSDATASVAREFEPLGVRVIRKQNEGAATTRNFAFHLSKGDYIQWLDADDLLSPDKITLQMEAAAAIGDSRALLSSGWSSFFYRHSRARFTPTALWADLTPAEWLLRKLALNLHMQTATWLVSRELTEAAGAWNTQLLGDDDGEYFCRVLLASTGVRFVRNARVYYRASGAGSLSYIGTSDRKRDAQWHSMKLHIQYLRSLEDTPRTRAACVTYMQNWLISFYPERADLMEQMQVYAHELDGALEIPRFPWKYEWIAALFGVHAARRAQILLPQWKWSALRSSDMVLHRLGVGTSTALRLG